MPGPLAPRWLIVACAGFAAFDTIMGIWMISALGR